MSTIPAFNSGVQTLYNANQQLNQQAHDIATHPVSQPIEATSAASDNRAGAQSGQSSPKPLTDSLVGLNQSETYAVSGTKVISTSNEMLGTLIDIEA